MVENASWAKKAGVETLVLPETMTNPDAVSEDARARLVRREVIERGEGGAEERAREVLESMMRRGQWGGVTTERMYEIAERWANEGHEQEAVTYITVFKFASGVLHPRKPGLMLKIVGDTVHPNIAVDPTHLPYCLFIANLLYISILGMVNEVFDQRWGAPIKQFRDDLKEAARIAKG